MSGRVRVGSRSGRGPFITAHTRPVPSVRSGWVGFFGFGSDFFGLGRVLGQKSRRVPGPWIITGQKLWPIPARCIGRVKSGQVFFGRVGWPMIRSSQHPLGDVSMYRDLGTMSNEQGSGHCFLRPSPADPLSRPLSHPLFQTLHYKQCHLLIYSSASPILHYLLEWTH